MGGGSRSRGTPHHRLLASPLHSQRLTKHWHWAQGQGHRGAGCRAVGRGALSHRLQAPHTSPPWGGGDASPQVLGIPRTLTAPRTVVTCCRAAAGGGDASPQVLGIPRTLTAPRTVVTCCRAGGGGGMPHHRFLASPARRQRLTSRLLAAGQGGGGCRAKRRENHKAGA